MSKFFFGVFCGALLLYTAMHYHVIRGNDGFHLVPKLTNDLSNIYVDTREFTISDWRGHKMVAAAIMEADQGNLMEDAALGTFRDSIGQLVNGLYHEE